MSKKPRLMKVDFDRESLPFFYYYKIGVTNEKVYLNIPVEIGFWYAIQRVNARYASENPNVPGIFANPPRIAAFIQSGKTALQLFPFPIQNMSSPAESGVIQDVVNPARPMSARPLNRSIRHNVLYRFRDLIPIEVSNITAVTVPGNADFSVPAYIDLLVMGRLYPAIGEQEGWGE